MALIYCRECGKQISVKASACPYCGYVMKRCDYNQSTSAKASNRSEKDWLTTFLLCWFLGQFGIHSFYAGKIGIGVVQLLTCGGCGIWWLVDFITIIVGSYHDGEGKVIKS